MTGKLSFFTLLWFFKGGRGKQVLLRPNKDIKANKSRCGKRAQDPGTEGRSTSPIYTLENQSPERLFVHLFNNHLLNTHCEPGMVLGLGKTEVEAMASSLAGEGGR